MVPKSQSLASVYHVQFLGYHQRMGVAEVVEEVEVAEAVQLERDVSLW
jgi:hypothetical protein